MAERSSLFVIMLLEHHKSSLTYDTLMNNEQQISFSHALSLLLLSVERLRFEMHILTKNSNYAPHLHDLTCICMCLRRTLCVRPVLNTAERGAVNEL